MGSGAADDTSETLPWVLLSSGIVNTRFLSVQQKIVVYENKKLIFIH